jgi:signal transduction histidine kinase
MSTSFLTHAAFPPLARGGGPRARRAPREHLWRVIDSGAARDAPDGKTPHDLTGQLLRAQDEERRRIARDLHDSTCQTLLAAALTLNRLKGHLTREGAPLLETVQSALADSMRELRTLSYLLHPPLLEECGLAAALRAFVQGYAQRSGIAVDLRLPADPGRMAPEVEHMLFRIVQESLTNVHRHSGSAAARVHIVRTRSALTLTIGDRGHGMARGGETAQIGVGIAGMRARVGQVGGTLRIRSGRWGTIVRARLPDVEAQPRHRL